MIFCSVEFKIAFWDGLGPRKVFGLRNIKILILNFLGSVKEVEPQLGRYYRRSKHFNF